MIKPTEDRVLIEIDAPQTKTSSGVLIPKSAQESPTQGIIIATGAGKQNVPMQVKTGDRVTYQKYVGTKFSEDEKDFIILQESDILAII